MLNDEPTWPWRLASTRVAPSAIATTSEGFADTPFALDTTQLARAKVSKIYPRACNEVSNSLGDKYLASVGKRADPGGDMNGYPGHVVAAKDTFACMNAYTQI